MNTNKLKGVRVSRGLTQEQISAKLDMAIRTYNRKELGIVEFSRKEILAVAQLLGLSLQEVNAIFFDNQLTDRLNNTETA